MALLVDGLCIKDTYEVEAFLGEGAFAEVYRVRHKFLGRQAIKLFKAPGWHLTSFPATKRDIIDFRFTFAIRFN